MDKKERKRWQANLRNKLEREAFNEKYECICCGKKEKLHIHHLVYGSDFESHCDPRFWRIVCENCHPRKKASTYPKIKIVPYAARKLIKAIRTKKEVVIYNIPCEGCKEIFLTEISVSRFCGKCQRRWMGKFSEYYELFPERDFRFRKSGTVS